MELPVVQFEYTVASRGDGEAVGCYQHRPPGFAHEASIWPLQIALTCSLTHS